MLWKRHLSIYSSGTPKLNDIKKDFSKGKTTLAPLLPAGQTISAHKTIDVSAPKFVIKKKSKSSKNIKQQIPNTFYLHRGNNFQLVKCVLEQAGCIETASKEASCLIWYQGKEAAKKDLQRKDISSKTVNYLPNHSEITNKQNLYENLTKFKPDCVGDFVPKTFVIDFKDNLNRVQANLSEFVAEYFRKTGIPKPKKSHSLVISNYYGEICILFSKVFKQLNEEHRQSYPESSGEKIRSNTENLWIVKPSFMNRGQGIEIISNLKQLEKILGEDSQQISIRMYQPEENLTPSSYVIQQYIIDPLLYRGYKFDIRVWILLRKSKRQGLQVFVYKRGYARLAGFKYCVKEGEILNEQKKKDGGNNDTSPQKQKKVKKQFLTDPYMHLTNNAVQKNGKNYGQVHEGNQLSLEDLVQALQNPNLTIEYLFIQFKRIITIMINSSKQKLLAKASTGSFQLMGLDFMIDSALKIWLIEANCNPCLEESSAMLKQILPKMLKQLLEIVNVDKIMGISGQKPQEMQTIPQDEINTPDKKEENLWEKIQY